MRRVLPAAVFLFAVTSCLRAQSPPVLGTIEFDGNGALPSADLLKILPYRSGASMHDSLLDQCVSAILGLYHREGYYGADVQLLHAPDTGGGNRTDITFRISEGPRAVLREIVLEGNRSLAAGRLMERFDSRPGEVLDVQRLEGDIGLLLDAYEEAGYPLAAVSLVDITPSPGEGVGGLVVTIAVEEGRPIDIVEMRVEGNTETRGDVVLRESRITPPERFDPEKNTRFRERLQRLGIFSSVDEPALYTTEEGGGLLVRVSEGRTNTFDGIIGYVPSPSPLDDGGSLAGMARIAMRNLFGTARKFEAQWARDPGSTQEIRLSYEEPWVFGFPFNLAGRFYQRQQDSSFVERAVGGEAVFLVTTSLSVSAVAEGRSIIPSESAGASAPRNSSTIGGGLVIRLDTRDDRHSPRKGVAYESEYRVGTKRVRDSPLPTVNAGLRGTVRNLSLDVDGYFELLTSQVLNLGFHARQLWSPFPESGDLYRLGGFRGLRGFRENRFLGSRLAWGVCEYRFLSAGKSFFYGFFDTGYIYSPLTDPHDLFTFGYGIGMRLETALGFISVSFALGEGDPVSETKIHFGLVNDF